MAADAGLDDVGVQLVAPAVEHSELLGCRHASPVGRQARSEHVRDEPELVRVTDRARVLGRGSDVLGGANQFGVRVAHLVLAQPPASILVDQMLPGETVVDLAAGLSPPEHPDQH